MSNKGHAPKSAYAKLGETCNEVPCSYVPHTSCVYSCDKSSCCYPNDVPAAIQTQLLKQQMEAANGKEAYSKHRLRKQPVRLQGRWDRYRPGGCGRHCGDGFCTIM
jgi:hypothetical protein